MDLAGIGKVLLFIGGAIIFAGLLAILVGKTGLAGRLPGDIFVQKGNFTFYFPIVTFIIISVVLTIIINIVIRLVK